MTHFNLKPLTHVSSLDAMEQKAARKKLLEEIKARRAENYKRFLKEQKRRLQENSDLATIA